MPDREMKPVLSPSVELLRPDGPTAKAMGAIMANVVAGFKVHSHLCCAVWRVRCGRWRLERISNRE